MSTPRRFIIIQMEPKHYKVSWIYYGGILNGIRVSKTFGVRSGYFAWLKKMSEKLIELVLEK